MKQRTRGTVYKSRAAVNREIRQDTARGFAAIGTAIFAVVGVAVAAVVIHPPLLGWLW